MTASARVSGVWRDLSALNARAGGVWRDIVTAYVKVSGVWREVYSAGGPPPPDPDPITASVSPDSLVWGNVGGGGSDWLTDSVTVSASGGTGPYSVVWEIVSGDAYTSATTPDLTTAFSSPFGYATVMRGLVTDTATGAQTYTNDVSIV